MLSLCDAFSEVVPQKERKAYCGVDKPRRLLESVTRDYCRKGPECSREKAIERTSNGRKNEVADYEKDGIDHWIRYNANNPYGPMKHLQSPPWVKLLNLQVELFWT